MSYVSGDIDSDGLLDTPDSIFEDEVDETWVFRCTTTVDEDTTNVVVVAGSPVDPDGLPLCGPEAGAGGIPPCDVTDRDRAHVTVVPGPGPGPEPGTGPGTGPGSGPGGGPTAGGLGDTGAPTGLWQLLVLGLLLLGAGGSMVAYARRGRAAPA